MRVFHIKKFLLTTTTFSLLGALLLLNGCNGDKKDSTVDTPKEEVQKHATFLEEKIVSAPLTDAQENRKKTDEMTKKEFQRVLGSPAGKQAYTKLMEIFNRNVSRIAAEGYNDTFVVWYMNDREIGIPKAFAGLNRLEQNYVRDKVIYDLENKGYTVKHNEYWNNPESINISVSW